MELMGRKLFWNVLRNNWSWFSKTRLQKRAYCVPGSQGSEGMRKGTIFFFRSKCQEFWADWSSPCGFLCSVSLRLHMFTKYVCLTTKGTIYNRKSLISLIFKLYWLYLIGNWFFYNWLTYDIFQPTHKDSIFFIQNWNILWSTWVYLESPKLGCSCLDHPSMSPASLCLVMDGVPCLLTWDQEGSVEMVP